MKLRLVWSRRALSRLDHIGRYIAEKNPDAANRVVQRIVSAVNSLCDFPAQGKVGRIASTRELVLADFPYIIVYRATDETLQVLTVMHTSQRWPARF
ncbi:type II toxin-antitoxin system RelE/ParE family toxin [Rhizobium sp. BR 362]|uniref:type II toxin-antitoxin system RelE/ParE family toxin n=1 Tax=Rhizobium sp. BR 362 TaxID=3040670 RepID=UPI002F41EF52